MRLVNWRALVLGAAGFGLAACGDDVTVTPPPISFTTNPTSISCVAGTQTAVGVTVAGGSGTPTVTFSAGNGNATVTGSGTSATVNCTTAGASSVNFTITSGGQTVSGSIPVTITGVQSPVQAVTINPTSATVAPGGSVQFTASVTLANNAPANTPTTVTFSSSDATVATVNATTGLVTAGPAATAAGRSAVITATSTANTNLVARATVTVGTAASLIQSLTVSPGTTTLIPGQTQQITSNVTLAQGAPAGTSTAVTFTSSDTSIARVSSTGVITGGSRAGTATITIASVAAPTVTQTVAVTVSQQNPVSLTIQSLTTTTAAGQTINVDQANVNGPIFLTLNLETGSFRPDSLVATLGNGQRVVCQRFTVQLAEAYRAASSGASADVQPVVCQLNTAQFDTTTGVPQVINGQQQLNATVFYRPIGGGTSTTQTAQIGVNLNVNNQSGFFVNVTNTPSATQTANGAPASGQTTGPQGVLWRAGTIRVQVVPVFFTPIAGTPTGTQTLSVALADANSPAGFATQQVTFNTGTPAVATFTGTSAAYTPTPANNTVNGYSSPNAGGINVAGGPAGAGALQGTQIIVNGNLTTTFLSAAGRISNASTIYIDNATPDPVPQFVSNNFLLSNTGTAGFLNGTFSFADSVRPAATLVGGGAISGLGDFNGVDRVSRTFFFANNPVPAGGAALTPGDIVAANQQVATGNNIPSNTSQTAFVAAVRLADALGNATAVAVQVGPNANGPFTNFTFGVSTATPTIAGSGNLNTNNSAFGQFTAAGAAVAQLVFAPTVSSPVGFGRNPSLFTVTRIAPNGQTFCTVAGTGDVTVNAAPAADIINNATSPANGAACPQVPAGSVSISPTAGAEGLYTITATSRDVAGNQSATLTRTFVLDRTPPTATNALPTTFPLRGGQSATFTANATDALGLLTGLAVINYTTAPDINLRYDGATLGSQFATPFTKTATVSVTVPTLIRTLQLQAGVTAQSTNPAATSNIGSIAVGALDVGNNPGFAPVITAGAVGALLDQTQALPTFFGTAAGLQSIDLRFTPNNTTTTSAAAALTLNNGTTGAATAVTITLRQNGVANTPFVSPFSRVELYQRSALPQTQPIAGGGASTNQYRLVGTFTTGGLTVTPTTSQILSTFTVTPGSSGITGFPTSAGSNTVDLLVVASDANGFAVAVTVPTITLTNP